MKRFFIIINMLMLTGCLYAGRRLSESEIENIISHFTLTRLSTWIDYGTIISRHRARQTGRQEAVTLETVFYDGRKFKWEIKPDNLSPAKSSSGKKRQGKDIDKTQHRVFVWDGQRYSMYFKSLKHAMYFDDTNEIPVTVNGPLTAGIIPWGKGFFSRERLSAADISAQKIYKGGDQYVAMRIQGSEKFVIEMLMDCSSSPYSVIVYKIDFPGKYKTIRTYGDFKLVGKVKVPRIILIEKNDESGNLISEEVWEVLQVSREIKAADPFVIEPEEETLVEFVSGKGKSLFGRYSRKADLDMLHEERIVSDWQLNGRIKNCGIKSALYVLGQYGVFPEGRYKYFNKSTESVSLYEIMNLIESNGLQCRAVRTDIAGLKKVSEFQVIVYFPFMKHFVVLDKIEAGKVWLVDLSSRKFYYSIEVDKFKHQWHGNVALIAADREIETTGYIKTHINDEMLKQLIGNGAYVCTEVIQPYKVVNCLEMDPNGDCDGRYYRYEERYGCVYDPNDTGEGCLGEGMLGHIRSECIPHSSYPAQCTESGDFISRDIRACTN